MASLRGGPRRHAPRAAAPTARRGGRGLTAGRTLILVADPGGGAEPAFGSYEAVALAGRRILAADLGRRLVSAGAMVAPLHAERAGSEPATGSEPFHWGAWFAAGARRAVAEAGAAAVGRLGYVGAGALALAEDELLAALVADVAGGEDGVAVNNRFSTDAFCVSGDLERATAALERCSTDNGAARCLEAAGFAVRDLSAMAWSRLDVDTPLDLALLRVAARLPGMRTLPTDVAGFLEMAVLPGDRRLVLPRLDALGAVVRDREAELVIAGRIPSSAWPFLETEAACRVRGYVEERGMRAARGAAPRSLLADWMGGGAGTGAGPVGSGGPGALILELASLGDAVILDTRVLMGARAGSSDAAAWPPAEERYASDFLDGSRVDTSWLRELTDAAAAAPVPVMLGGHALLSDGLRILVRAAWLGH